MSVIEEIEGSNILSYTLDAFAGATGFSKESIRQEIDAGNLVPSYGGKRRTKPVIIRAEGIRWLKSLPNERPGRAS